jgi:hypothetical protein
MTTLAAISFTLAGGIGCFAITLGLFGCAVRNQSTYVAARCTARPSTVIFNPKPTHPSQDRGNPMLGWIMWVMRLSYSTMLHGVPGTGTRDGGLAGTMLKVNLDGIVLLRFHHLCLRVSSMAAILYMCVALPLYFTVQCSRLGGDEGEPDCLESNYNLTDYQRLTLANVPTLDPLRSYDFKGLFLSLFLPDHNGILARLYAVVFCSWLVTWYAMQQLEIEWSEVLAMRRVYYLEADHWGDRNEELKETLFAEDASRKKHEALDEHMIRREPWVPHPEQRDTVPSIGLYSLLVGGLPSLPTEVVDREDMEAVFSRKQSVDWQLSVATAFFDHCVPNQPGFSSSVAAVTMLPAAFHLTEAWNKWYKAAAKLRRLRFIRQQIADRRHYDIDEEAYPEDDYDIDEEAYTEDEADIQEQRPTQETPGMPMMIMKPPETTATVGSIRQSVYKETEETKRYYQEVLGTNTDVEVEQNLMHALNFGPEQTAVYSREFALSAANCAPNGCCEGRIRRAGIDELIEMEHQAVEEVHEANLALRRAQEAIAEDDEVFEVIPEEESSSNSEGNLSQDELIMIMESASRHSKPRIERMSSGISTGMSSGMSSGELGYSTDGDSFGCEEDFAIDVKINSEVREATHDGIAAVSLIRTTPGSKAATPRRFKSSPFNKNALTEPGPRKRPNRRRRGSISTTQLPGELSLESELLTRSVHNSKNSKQVSSGSMIHTIRGSSSDSPGMQDKRISASQPFIASKTSFPSQIAVSIGMPNLLSLDEPVERSSEVGETVRGSDEGSDFPTRDSAFWAKLEEDKRRKAKIRARLASIQSMSSGESQESSLPSARNLHGLPEDKPTVASEVVPPKPPGDFPPLSAWRRPSPSELPREEKKDGNLPESVLPSKPTGVWRKSLPAESARGVWRRSLPADSAREEKNNRHESGMPSDRCGMSSNSLPSSRADSLIAKAHLPSMHKEILKQEIGSQRQLRESIMSTRSIVSMTSYSYSAAEGNLRMAQSFETDAGLRENEEDTGLRQRANKKKIDKWARVIEIAQDGTYDKTRAKSVSDGNWRLTSCREIFQNLRALLVRILCCMSLQLCKTPDAVDKLARDSTYAVVTFTSRQAAVAARHCLADARGGGRWTTVSEIPIAPLADSPACNMKSFRGCVRPVTLSLSDKQKLIRYYFALMAVLTVYFFYTIPLIAAQQLVEPERLQKILPDILIWQEQSAFLANILSGLVPALIWTGFFALCPALFKIIANFGSNATSSVNAENVALWYFWWFMVLAAFSGTSLSTAIIKGFNEGVQIGAEIQGVIEATARAIPGTVSATWLNWMIVRVTIVLPTQYLLQMNTFLFSFLGLKCCSRSVRGGGSGPPVPYRIYIDSGVVMLCLFALAPASPLIAPAAFLYYLFCTPLLRWTMIFLYKPKFDVGGQRFPFIFDMCVSGMFVGQILLTTMMTLKQAAGPAIAAALPMIPTLAFRVMLRRRYLRAFTDAALLQISLLDGWDTTEETSKDKREEFRRFLVDSHKAAYVPVCIAGDQSVMITAEPAVVVPLENDVEDLEVGSVYLESSNNPSSNHTVFTNKSPQGVHQIHRMGLSVNHHPAQPGPMLRRTSHTANFQTSSPHVHSPFTSPMTSPRKRTVAIPREAFTASLPL